MQILRDVEQRTAPSTEPAVRPPLVPPTHKRGVWIATLIAAAAIVVLFLITRSAQNPRSTSPVRTVEVHAGTLERTLRLTGSTVGENSMTLLAPHLRGSRTRGGGIGRFHLVLQELIPEGARVAVGDKLAMFDRESMLQQIADLKAEGAQAEGNLRVLAAKLAADREARGQQIRLAKAAVETAALDLKTAPVRSAIQGDVFRLNLDESRARYNQLLTETEDFETSQKAQLKIAQLEFQQSEAEVERAEANAERMVVRAPRAGLVVFRQTVRNGAYATIRAGDELRPGQPYLDIVAPGPMLVESAVNQVDIKKLHVGAPAEVVAEAFPDIRLPARVTAIGNIAMSGGFRGNFVREVPVRLKITGSDPRLLPSLSVKVDVVLDRVENAALVPRGAVFSRSSAGQNFAVVQGHQSWERRNLDLGLTNNTTVAVLAGLKDGDIVAAELPPEVAN